MKKLISRDRALEVIGRFSSSNVLVVGDMMVDQFIWGKVSRISPEAPVPVVRVTNETLLLGGCANVVNNIYSIGGKSAVVGVVGSDNMGGWLVNTLKTMKIDTGGTFVEEGRPTSVKTRVIANNQQVVRFDREEKKPISEHSISRIIEYIRLIKDNLGAIIISDYKKGVIFKNLIEGIREAISGRDIFLCVDPKQNNFALYRDCALITPNKQEAERALGVEFENEDDVIRGGRKLLASYDFGAVLITLGEEGMMLFEKNGDVTPIHPLAREVFDVTGAGDTVIGIFALSMAAGASLKEAAVLSNYAASIVVGKVGTAKVSQDELKSVI
ncbi:MAG: D-glycero-beta-D-manno-heptose-7-phosphate kinase [Deltaproteobacteria bacterium]|nr:D-glycero-beta-D-manno-heptose-7-phosphate kinase [Deltaproteobacteria bacterium]